MRKVPRMLFVVGVLAVLVLATTASTMRPKCWICTETEQGLVCKSVPCP